MHQLTCPHCKHAIVDWDSGLTRRCAACQRLLWVVSGAEPRHASGVARLLVARVPKVSAGPPAGAIPEVLPATAAGAWLRHFP